MNLAGRGKARKKTAAAVRSVEKPVADPLALLAWYDRHRRILPWRARRGEKPDPYKVWLSEIMLQQTTVKAVAPYYARFLARWPNVDALAEAELDEVLAQWAGLGYYARARNLHACAREIAANNGGVFPSREDALLTLPGVGTYTAAALAAIAYDARTVPVDGNVERVVSRLFAVKEELPAAKPRIKELATSLLPPRRAGDFAQALMDLGATICTPKKPACVLCPWNAPCVARARGEQETFPRKAPKPEGELRRGAAFVALRTDGRVLLRRRPPRGLLGGMSEVPGSEWSTDFSDKKARVAAPQFNEVAAPQFNEKVIWRRSSGKVTHTFTHFPLELMVYVARVSHKARAPAGMRWVKLSELAGAALPSVMRKVLAHALELR